METIKISLFKNHGAPLVMQLNRRIMTMNKKLEEYPLLNHIKFMDAIYDKHAQHVAGFYVIGVMEDGMEIRIEV